MAENQSKQPAGLWVLLHEPAAAPQREVALTPDEALYALRANTRNPYLQRALAPGVKRLERSDGDLRQMFRSLDAEGYAVDPVNASDPYRTRMVPHPPPGTAVQATYAEASRLPGDVRRLPWLIHAFFRSVLERLEADPWALDPVVEDLVVLLQENGIRIRLYRAYQTLADFEDLMETLREIARYPAPETFDLFCSALLTYYDLVHPSDAPLTGPPEQGGVGR